MKAITAVALMTMGLAVSLMAENFNGVVMDEKCSGISISDYQKVHRSDLEFTQ